MGYQYFRDYILASGQTLEPFITGLLTIIKKERYKPSSPLLIIVIINEYPPTFYHPPCQYYQLWISTIPLSPKRLSSRRRITILKKRRPCPLQCNQRNTLPMLTRDYDRKNNYVIIISNDSQRKKSCKSFKTNSLLKSLKISLTKDSMI